MIVVASIVGLVVLADTDMDEWDAVKTIEYSLNFFTTIDEMLRGSTL